MLHKTKSLEMIRNPKRIETRAYNIVVDFKNILVVTGID